MNLAERVYKVLLGLYPKDFRERYALEMMQTFRDAHRQARLEHKMFVFWFGTLTDAILSASREHTRGAAGSMSPIVRVGAVCFVMNGLYDMYRLSRLLWMDWNQFPDGPGSTLLSLIIGAIAIAGWQAMRTAPASVPEKFGFAVLWVGWFVGGAYNVAQDVLFNVPFPSFWLEPMRTVSGLLQPIAGVLFPLMMSGLIVVIVGRALSSGLPLRWNRIPLEIKLWLGLVAFILLSSLQAPISIDVAAPRTVYIPFALMHLPDRLLIIALGVVLWVKSSSSSLPPQTKTA